MKGLLGDRQTARPHGVLKRADRGVIRTHIAARVFLRGRADTALEVLALRQQVAVLKRRQPRPPFSVLDRLFWTVLRETWARWNDVLVIVKPETVVNWHRAGFRLYWRTIMAA